VSKKKRSIRLTQHERESLVQLYVESAIPVDQYEERPEELSELCIQWQKETGRTDPSGDILHYMRSQRKMGKWVRLGKDFVKRKPRVKLDADETELLIRIVQEHVTSLGSGTDNIAYEAEVGSLIAKEFSTETGRRVPPGDLIAAVTAIRKRGLLDKVEKSDAASEDVGFKDIDQATG